MNELTNGIKCASSLATGCDTSADAFIRALSKGTEGYLELRFISEDRVRSEFYRLPLSNLPWEQIRRLNGTGFNVFFGVCPRSRKRGRSEDVLYVTALWVDLDAKDFDGGKQEALAQLQRTPLHLQPSVLVDSGHGYHAYWLLKEPYEADETIKETLIGLARFLNADHTQDLARLLRLPGTLNQKDRQRPLGCEIVHLMPERCFNLSDFEDYRVETAETGIRAKLDVISAETPPRVAHLLKKYPTLRKTWDGSRTNLKDSSRSGYDMSMASDLVRYGCSNEDIAAALINMPSGRGADANIDYLERTIGKARKKGRAKSANQIANHKGDELNQATQKCQPYTGTPEGFFLQKGDHRVQLSNFTARIEADIEHDDGAAIRRSFAIKATLNGRTSSFTIPAEDFGGMKWPMKQIGGSAIVFPGQLAPQHVGAAIQMTSGDIPHRCIYGHTGWRKLSNGVWAYLHTDGAIGAAGALSGVDVALDGPLACYRLPPPPAKEQFRDALAVSLGLLNLGPWAVMLPVLAAVYLAAIADLLGDYRPDFLLWLHGPSGVFKTELATLAQAHFGPFARLNLPGSFTATVNALERQCFLVKDALIVIDDYYPATTHAEAQQLGQCVSRLLRSVGNGRGRIRMRADTTLRNDYYPRGLPLATAERLPEGHSTMARLLAVPVEPGAINPARLSELQGQRDLLTLAMSGFLQWVAADMDRLRRELPADFQAVRDMAVKAGAHRREPSQVAHIMMGFDVLLQCALVHGVLSEAAVKSHQYKAWDTMLALGKEQADMLHDETVVSRFLHLLSDGIASKQIYFEARFGGAPADGDAWGWEAHYTTDTYGEENRTLRHRPGSTLIGHLDADFLYLLPEITQQFLVTTARNANQAFPADPRTLLRRLDEAGLIVKHSEGKRQANVRLGSEPNPRPVRVIKLKRVAFEQNGDSDGDHIGQSGRTVPPVPPNVGPTTTSWNTTTPGQQNAFTSSVPTVPPVPHLSITNFSRGKRYEAAMQPHDHNPLFESHCKNVEPVEHGEQTETIIDLRT